MQKDLTEAILTDCQIYGLSAWNVFLKGTIQNNLIITREDEPLITVDNLKVAQFIYLLLNNNEIRDVITTLTTKIVLIPGRFTPQHKRVLNVLKDTLRTMDYVQSYLTLKNPQTEI